MRRLFVLMLTVAMCIGTFAQQTSTYLYTFGCETFKGSDDIQKFSLNGRTVRFYQENNGTTTAANKTHGVCSYDGGLKISVYNSSTYAKYFIALSCPQCSIVSVSIDISCSGTGSIQFRDFVRTDFTSNRSGYFTNVSSQQITNGVMTFQLNDVAEGFIFRFEELNVDVCIKSISYEYIDESGETHYILYDRGAVVGEFGVVADDEPCSLEYSKLPACMENFAFAGWTAENTNADAQSVTTYEATNTAVTAYHAVYEHKVLGVSLKEYIYDTETSTLSPQAPTGVTVSGMANANSPFTVAKVLKISSPTQMVISDISLHAKLSDTGTSLDELFLITGRDTFYTAQFVYDWEGVTASHFYDFGLMQHSYAEFGGLDTMKIRIKPDYKSITCDAVRFAMGEASCVESRYYNHPESIETYRRFGVAMDGTTEETDETVQLRDGVEVVKRVDDSKYYFFSLPFDCPFDHISIRNVSGPIVDEYYSGIENDAYVGDWVISRYREDWAANGQTGWEDIELAELQQNGLQKNVGYTIGIVPENAVVDVKFRSQQNYEIGEPAETVLPTQYTQTAQGAKYKGWNLLGNPYYQSIDYKNLNVNYILVPKANGVNYKICHRYAEGYSVNYEIKPFSAYFVQRQQAGDVRMTPSAAQQMMSEEQTVQHFNIVVERDSDVMDYATILINDDFSADYETGRDLMKMLASADEPEIYTVLDDAPMAVNAQAFGIGDVIPLSVYIPKKDEYTIRLGENIYLDDNMTVALYDKNENIQIDLRESEYKFTRNKGTANNRFEIRILAKTAVCDLRNAENVVYSRDGRIVVKTEAETVAVYDVDGRMVDAGTVENGVFVSKELSKGIYVVKMEDSAEKCVVY